MKNQVMVKVQDPGFTPPPPCLIHSSGSISMKLLASSQESRYYAFQGDYTISIERAVD
jgi:hypothetical protein